MAHAHFSYFSQEIHTEVLKQSIGPKKHYPIILSVFGGVMGKHFPIHPPPPKKSPEGKLILLSCYPICFRGGRLPYLIWLAARSV